MYTICTSNGINLHNNESRAGTFLFVDHVTSAYVSILHLRSHWQVNRTATQTGSRMAYSHHSHSGQFCKHGSGLLEDVVLEAIRQGFEMYGLTEHVPRYRPEDLYPEEVINISRPCQSSTCFQPLTPMMLKGRTSSVLPCQTIR